MNTLQGHLLIAAPDLTDPNFFQKVVLLIQHNSDGAFGVVLNGPTNRQVSEIWDQGLECDEPINLGGPVTGPPMAIHTKESLADAELMPGVYFSMGEKLEALVYQEIHPFRVFLGCAGWAAGQLEAEIEEGAWLTLPATADHIFHVGEDLWQSAIQDVAGYDLASLLNVKYIPHDVSLN